jgi:hypothetical protein
MEWPDLMEMISNHSAVVIWKLDTLKWPHVTWPDAGDQVTWSEFRELFQEEQASLDAACVAALSGPIRFNLVASNGNAMLLPHLAPLKHLEQILGGRTMLALHDGDLDAAWTNWMAATRLVTAWEPEPVEISELVRFAQTKLAFKVTWQALQVDGWQDERLARLQAEWEAVDFFTNLPETAAFKRAADAASYERGRHGNGRDRPLSDRSRPPLIEFVKNALRSPWAIWSEMGYRWREAEYARGGQYEEERDLLLDDQKREIELRNAVRAQNWSQMRELPGVTNRTVFQTKYFSGIRSQLAMREIGMAFQRSGGGFLGRAAEAEAERRILIVGLALERYRGKHGAYPQALAALAPEFIKAVPADFMDGQPLRHRLNDGGHYLLYSVGLDCADNGGELTKAERPTPADFRSGGLGALPKGDIVWPFPASTTTVEALRRQQLAVIQNKADQVELDQAKAQWKHAANHQADVDKVLASPVSIPPDVDYHGRPLSEVLRNVSAANTNPLTLRDLLTLKQVITGGEPEVVTFELPISYDALKRAGEIYLLIDTNNDDSDEGCVVQHMNCNRADNGDCLLVWDTIYESPGKHALRAGLETHGQFPKDGAIEGPPLAFVITNLCQFSITSAHFDPRLGAAFQLKLPELNGRFVLQCQRTNGMVLRTLNGMTTNGIVSVRWDLKDEKGRRIDDDSFNAAWTITLPGSGRTQNLRGP